MNDSDFFFFFFWGCVCVGLDFGFFCSVVSPGLSTWIASLKVKFDSCLVISYTAGL